MGGGVWGGGYAAAHCKINTQQKKHSISETSLRPRLVERILRSGLTAEPFARKSVAGRKKAD